LNVPAIGSNAARFALPFLAMGAVDLGCAAEPERRLAIGLTTDYALGFDARVIALEVVAEGGAVLADAEFRADGEVLPALVDVRIPGGIGAIAVTSRALDREEVTILTARAEVDVESLDDGDLLPWDLARACEAIACGPGEACLGGECTSASIDAATLGATPVDWIANAPDACRGAVPAAPSLVLGEGLDGYAPLVPGATVPVEPGPQGGHHVWLALRTRGLRQLGSTLTVRGTYPALGIALPPMQNVVSLRRADEGGTCEIYGVRFQIDRGIPLDTVLGATLAIEATLTDPSGASAAVESTITIGAPVGG
jgi:hypothetical protein